MMMMLSLSLLSPLFHFFCSCRGARRTSDHRPPLCLLSLFRFFLHFSRDFYPRHGERSEFSLVTGNSAYRKGGKAEAWRRRKEEGEKCFDPNRFWFLFSLFRASSLGTFCAHVPIPLERDSVHCDILCRCSVAVE